MGTSPRETEAAAHELLRELLEDDFHFKYGHELRADLFLCAKSGGADVPEAGRRWLAVQLKATTTVTSQYRRKVKYQLRQQKQGLDGIVLLGISLDPADRCIVHLVHKNRCCDHFDASDEAFQVDRAGLAAHLTELWEEKHGTCLQNPALRYVFSTATLAEVEAREAFQEAIADSDLRHEVARTEGQAVDGYLFSAAQPGTRVRIQEKVLVWRSNGRNYRRPDADYLLLHARANHPGAGTSFRLFGSALIPFEALEQNGYLASDEEGPGRAIFAMYPAAPGVKNARNEWAEACFTLKADIITKFTDELCFWSQNENDGIADIPMQN
eukprot:g8368.t1